VNELGRKIEEKAGHGSAALSLSSSELSIRTFEASEFSILEFTDKILLSRKYIKYYA
jgi:hypothetical protein